MIKKNKSPNTRFKGFTDDWEQCKLSDITTMKARIGWQGLTQKEFLDQGDYYLITGTDFKDGEIDFKNCHYIGEDRYNQDVNIQVKNGDVLITKDGTIGKVALIKGMDKPATLNAGVFVIRGKNININNLYLYQYLSAPYLLDYANKKATGGTIKHLNQNVLVNFPIPISKVEEQEKIGKYFLNFDNLIKIHQRKLDKLIDIKKAMLEKMFPIDGSNVPEIRFKGFIDNWKQCKLGDIGSVAMNRRIFKQQTSEEGDVPFYKIGTFGSKPDAFISRELFEEYKLKYPYPERGDILISASGSIGRTVEYMGEDEYFQDSNIVWLQHDDQVINSFLKQFYSVVKWSGLEGSTIKRLYNKNILDTTIFLPESDEQKKIGQFFIELDNLIMLYQCEIEKLKNIKKACIENMFL